MKDFLFSNKDALWDILTSLAGGFVGLGLGCAAVIARRRTR